MIDKFFKHLYNIINERYLLAKVYFTEYSSIN